MILKKHRIPIYGGQLWICVTRSFVKSIDQIEDAIDVKLDESKEDLRKSAAMSYRFYTPDGQFRILIMVKPITSIGTIAHEALHAVNWMFAHCGIQYSLKNDEPQCYILGWVVDKVISAIYE